MGKGCFLCDPDKALLIGRTPTLQLISGLGPITDTYVVLGALNHVRCMADVAADAPEVVHELEAVRNWLSKESGAILLTEHGRVPLCTEDSDPEKAKASNSHDEHCYHAHLLAFASSAPIDDELKSYFLACEHFDNLADALAYARSVTSYVLSSPAANSYNIFSDPIELPRQLTRVLVAAAQGTPHLGNWRLFPDFDAAEATATRLRPSFEEQFP